MKDCLTPSEPLCLHIVLKYDGCGNHVNKFLVLTSLLPDARVEHGAMGKNGGVAFVIPVDRNSRQLLLKSSSKRAYSIEVLAVCSVFPFRHSKNNRLHLLSAAIIFYERHLLSRRSSH